MKISEFQKLIKNLYFEHDQIRGVKKYFYLVNRRIWGISTYFKESRN